MNDENKGRISIKNTAKELAQLAVFVALVIAAQFALSFIPGVEIVTLLFVVYAFTFGIYRGTLAATAFVRWQHKNTVGKRSCSTPLSARRACAPR